MKMLTRQEIFNKVYLGLKGQGFKQSFRGILCAYRGSDGLKCAAGHLIEDKYYSSEIEELSVGDCIYPKQPREWKLHNALCKSGIFQEDFDFVNALQNIHDLGTNCHNETSMEQELKQFATRYNLTIPE